MRVNSQKSKCKSSCPRTYMLKTTCQTCHPATQTAIQNRQSAILNQESAIYNRESAI